MKNAERFLKDDWNRRTDRKVIEDTQRSPVRMIELVLRQLDPTQLRAS
jgi:hypothetical protein